MVQAFGQQHPECRPEWNFNHQMGAVTKASTFSSRTPTNKTIWTVPMVLSWKYEALHTSFI